MNNNEILNKYIDLIDKGYCSDCNELNCIDNFPHSKITHAIRELQKENKKLKMINEEYERLNKEKYRGFKIIDAQEYDRYELLSYKNYKDNWNKLKNFLEECKENEEYCYLASSPIDRCRKDIYGEILDKMQELEKGSDNND